jgi:hypothetical protein
MRKLVALVTLTALPFSFGLSGCAMLPHGYGAGASPSGYQVPQASKDMIRAQEKQAYAMTDGLEDDAQTKLEKDLGKALKFALGQDGMVHGAPVPAPASKNITALRAAGIKLRIEPVTNEDGGQVADDYVQLKDSFTDRVKQLQPKLVAGTASAAEQREIQRGVKMSLKLVDLQMQVLKISGVALTANSAVQTGGMGNMLKIANMVRTRKMMSMDFNDEDWARVKSILGREKRKEAVAASTLGMLAAFEAVINDGGDPKALDTIATSTLSAFPLQIDVSDDDAKAYVANLSQNASDQKAKYEAWMRKAYGDAKYERQFKASIDSVFNQAATASQQKSVGEMQSDRMAGYNADLAKCARGEDPGPGSMVGPAKCKAQRDNGGAGGDTSGAGGANPITAGTNALLGGLINGGTAAKASPQTPGTMDRAASGVGAAQAAANGDVTGALQGAADAFPGDGPIHSSLEGIAALTKGDPKGALSAAMNLVPGGSLVKEGLGAAMKLLKLI